MLEKIIELTNEYIEGMPKKERKKYGQFFTSMETARFMAGLYNIDEKQNKENAFFMRQVDRAVELLHQRIESCQDSRDDK